MSSLRQRILPFTSLSLVSAAAVAVLYDAAAAQDVPVRYGTDPMTAAEGPQILSYRPGDVKEERREDILHRVEPGDTVYALARRYDVSPGAIIDVNELEAPFGLQVGDDVIVPITVIVDAAPAPRAVSTRSQPASVEPRSAESDALERLDRLYRVRKGDTLYSLSRRFDMTVEQLAAANDLDRPYTLSVDQRIIIPGAPEPAPVTVAAAMPEPIKAPDPRILDNKFVEETLRPEALPEPADESPFAWPVRGPLLAEFGTIVDGTRSDGLNIAAPIGAPIRATADGEVVYRGDELEGYGNLLLVKHDGGWVSAYAHADAILVRKGDYVRQGQVIAKVGESGAVKRPQLHFQLRKDLQPQDPMVAMQLDAEERRIIRARLD